MNKQKQRKQKSQLSTRATHESEKRQQLLTYRGGYRFGRTTAYGRRGQGLRRPNVRSLDRLETAVTAFIKVGIIKGILTREYGSNFVTREAIARNFNVPEHAVSQVFQRMKVKGLLGSKENEPAHDSPRHYMFWGHDSAWEPSRYRIRFDHWETIPA